VQVEPRTGARFIKEDTCLSCGRCNEACIFPTSDMAIATNQGQSQPQTSRITYDPDADTCALTAICASGVKAAPRASSAAR